MLPTKGELLCIEHIIVVIFMIGMRNMDDNSLTRIQKKALKKIHMDI